jgi:type II secretory pathway component PulF
MQRRMLHPLIKKIINNLVYLFIMRKKAFIAGGVIALFLILSSSHALAADLQLNPTDIASIRSEIASGKPIKDVLEEHHITMATIREALGAVLHENGKHHKLSNTQIATIATKLGLDGDQIEEEIASGKSLHEILKAHNITRDQIEAVFQKRPHRPRMDR